MFIFLFRIKGGGIKGSIDLFPPVDYDIINMVFSEIDIVHEFNLCSERISMKDLDKMELEYANELKDIKVTKTKQSIWRYLKVNKSKNDEDKKEEPTKDPFLSQNPKLNINIAVGLRD